ncbi:hypothetical protein BJ944DRAFT_240020 [Cunninghamella echinulata]|nr:hypothetical protein BJ944DRAFT_240020 [Cunninghamella echinulata]
MKIAIILPSVSGKTTLCKEYPNFLEDIDGLPNDNEKCKLNDAISYSLVNDTQENWNYVNNIWIEIVNKKSNINKILLCHSPDQLPNNYEYYIINTPIEPYLNNTINDTRRKTAILNRKHLYNYSKFSNYEYLNSPSEVYEFIQKLIKKYHSKK